MADKNNSNLDGMLNDAIKSMKTEGTPHTSTPTAQPTPQSATHTNNSYASNNNAYTYNSRDEHTYSSQPASHTTQQSSNLNDLWSNVTKARDEMYKTTPPQATEQKPSYTPPTGGTHHAQNSNSSMQSTPSYHNNNMPNPAAYTPSPTPVVNNANPQPAKTTLDESWKSVMQAKAQMDASSKDIHIAPMPTMFTPPPAPQPAQVGPVVTPSNNPKPSTPVINQNDMSSYAQSAVNRVMQSTTGAGGQAGAVDARHHDFTTARQVVRAAQSNANVEENYIAEERNAVDRKVAVMALVVGDYDRHAATSAINSFNSAAASLANVNAKADKMFGTTEQIRASANPDDLFKQKSEFLKKNLSDRDQFINSVMKDTIVNRQGFTLQTGTDNAYSKMQDFASKGNWSATSISGGKSVSAAKDLGSFSRAELNDIAKTGGFTRNGIRYTYANNGKIDTLQLDKKMVSSGFLKEVETVENGKTVKKTVGELDNIRDLAKNAILQQDANNQLLQVGKNSALAKNAGVTSSIGTKAGSAKQAVEIKKAYLRQLEGVGVKMRIGDTREVNKAIAGINRQLKNKVITAEEARKQLDAIAIFKQSGLTDVNINHGKGLNAKQMRGLDIVVGNVLGQDIQTGARTTAAIFKGAQAAAKITDRAVGAIVFGGKNRELKFFGRNITVGGRKLTVGGHFHKAVGKAGEKAGDALVNNTVGRLVEKVKPGFNHNDLNLVKRTNVIGNRARNENLRRQEMGTLKWGKEKIDKAGVKARRIHRNNAEKRLAKSEKKLMEMKKTAKTQREIRKVQKMEQKLLIKKRGGRFNIWKDNHKVLVTRLSRIKNKITGTGKKLFNIVLSPFKAIAELKKKIMSWLMEHVFSKLLVLFGWIALILLLIIVLVIFVIPIVGAFLMLILFFISDILNGTSLATSMTAPDYQYVQYIIDNTIDGLGVPLLDVIENDVKRHVMAVMANDGTDPDADGIYGSAADADISEMENPNYDWYRKIKGGEIGSIHASETGEELPGIMANLEPIVSMMHYRMYEELTYIDWPQCEAYVFYLFVKSHNLDPDEPYSLRVEDECARDAIYSHAIVPSNKGTYWDWDEETHTLNRFMNGNEEKCENVYLHGYSIEYAKAVFKAYCNSVEFLTDPSGTLQYWLTKLSISVEPSDDALHAQGVFKDEIPYDSKGTCTSWNEVRFGNKANKLTGCYTSYTPNWDEGGDSYDLYAASGCPGYEHTHGSDCYETDDIFVKDGDSDPDLSGWNVVGTSYGDTDEYGNYGKTIHVSKKKCVLVEHTHTAWSSGSSPGCWATAYICRGHCGGHITPLINIAIDYDFSTLETLDSFRVTRPIAESEVTGVVSEFISAQFTTLQDWRAYWDLKIFTWFLPWPSTPLAFYELCAKYFALAAAAVIDLITSAIGGFIAWITGTPTSSDLQARESEEGEEIYDFDGWYEDGRPGDLSTDLTAVEIAEQWKPYERYTDDLKSLYGEMASQYEEGYQNWEDFEIIFPMSIGKMVSTEDKTKILKAVGASDEDIQKAISGDYSSISDSHARVVAAALDRVGKFQYECSNAAHRNGVYGDYGLSDCSGFVAGTLRLAYGRDSWSGWNAARFYNNSNTSVKTPGCILSHNKGGISKKTGVYYSGHVVIFVGDVYGDGVNYIIDCGSTPSPGGSRIRPDTGNYTHIYDPG